MPYCCVCDQTVSAWLPYPHAQSRSPLMQVLDTVGSDPDVFMCPVCGCHDRDRHLWLYMRASGVKSQLKGASILHMAPEPHLEVLIEATQPARYIRGDLHPQRPHLQRVDLEDLPFEDNSLDLIICNHILEHVHHPEVALSEIHRVLRPGGIVIAQTPYAPGLKHTLEMKTVPDSQTAHLLYGQADHVRLFGDDIRDYFHAAGLQGDLLDHQALLPGVTKAEFGCNEREPFFVFWKAQQAVATDETGMSHDTAASQVETA
ncbi:MAG TPA: methyltransferase domain-containing protein [Aquabacterium sp.]|uniref:class I SAM-dependent methyltransferase n=1 Tax=Aquabacterium sp. TaxID=1872578 RepID=UPI002E30E834|nr:methyltransferase domain-containing protein [Aquabacterium sp.]HEX5356545.1 methyltransferase domain-containing protein [Aquabacterium sp.]